MKWYMTTLISIVFGACSTTSDCACSEKSSQCTELEQGVVSSNVDAGELSPEQEAKIRADLTVAALPNHSDENPSVSDQAKSNLIDNPDTQGGTIVEEKPSEELGEASEQNDSIIEEAQLGANQQASFTVGVSHLNVRKGPSMEFEVVDVLAKGTSVEAKGREGIWIMIGENRYLSIKHLLESSSGKPEVAAKSDK